VRRAWLKAHESKDVFDGPIAPKAGTYAVSAAGLSQELTVER